MSSRVPNYWRMGNINSIRLYKLWKLKINMHLLRRCWSQFFQFWYPWNNRIFSADWYFLRKYFSKAVLLFEKPGYRKSNYYFSANDININKAQTTLAYTDVRLKSITSIISDSHFWHVEEVTIICETRLTELKNYTGSRKRDRIIL